MVEQLLSVLVKSGGLLLDFAPYVIGGVLLAEILKYTPWTRTVRAVIGNSPKTSIITSSILGIISPLCTYGTVPLVINLYRSGVPLAPLITFLSASSLMNPQLFIITWGGLGLELAILRIAGVLVFTLMLGLIILQEKRFRFIDSTIVRHTKFTRETSTEKYITAFKLRDFSISSLRTLEFVGFYIVTGIVLSSLLEAFIPVSSLLSTANPNKLLGIIGAALVGIPLYACGGGTIPLIQMLLSNGMSRGAALAFLIVGPATRITPLLALASFLKPQMIVLYVLSIIFFSVFLGMAFI